MSRDTQSLLAHRLKELVTLQHSTRTEDGLGGFSTNWTTLATVWAEVIPAKTPREDSRQQLTVRGRYRVLIRYRDDVTADTRILYRERILTIDSITTDPEEQRALVIEAHEGEIV